jgi:hypothetical protein
MVMVRSQSRSNAPGRWLVLGWILMSAAACTSQAALPPARPVVNAQGVRLNTSQIRMDSAAAWVTREITNIAEDPAFMIITSLVNEPTYPWDSLELTMNEAQDTAVIHLDGLGRDATTAYQLYAHLHLMHRVGRMEEFYPEAVELEGFELERAILARVAEAWLYGRAILSTIPHPVWDEITYAAELGYLDQMILVAQADQFPEERAAWEEDFPSQLDAYVEWFESSFGRPPPGLRPTGDGGEDEVRSGDPKAPSSR